jgi:GTP cyclohydrolase II
MERFVIDVLQACQTVKGACTLVGISWDQAWHVLDRAVARGLARKEADTIARIGIGLVEKIKAYQLQDKGLDTVEANLALGFKADSRDYGIGIQLLKDLGLRRVRLLTNNPKKTDAFIYGGFDLEVVDQVPILPPVHEFNEKYLATKREKLGHRFP